MNSSIPETTENKKIDEGETNSAEKSLGYSSDLSDNEGNDKKKRRETSPWESPKRD